MADPEWGRWSDREIARQTQTSHPFVARVRASLETVTSESPRLYRDRYGNVVEMNTANIGARPAPWPDPLSPEDWADGGGREPPIPDAEGLEGIAWKRILPPLTRREYAGLKRSIAEHGVISPVELDQDGRIIDGFHRVRAWTELRAEGVDVPDYPRSVRHYADDAERVAMWERCNLRRTSLTRSQQAMLEAVLVEIDPDTAESADPVTARAALIRREAPDLVAGVIAGAYSILDADGEVRQRRERAASPGH